MYGNLFFPIQKLGLSVIVCELNDIQEKNLREKKKSHV